ncbi:Peptidase S24-like [Porphyromonas macacae]|uniref:Peptidase S24-like n=1 Tax=Porphyromonas macacae TaxID=28115 RepID=A0A379E7I2_9PORP|nr:S24/S26 family peptidase [Porphyromonas macacae]SUB88264.1 Peptidase S24-like [Porphyromonas macacae]
MNGSYPNNRRSIDNLEFFRALKERECFKTSIKGNSMLPFIRGDKDEVLLQKASSKSLKPGKIVVAYIKEKTFFMHRIERVDGDVITLRGDGNAYTREQCSATEILAEVVKLYKNGKVYTPDSFRWKAMRRLWPSSPFIRRVLLAIYRQMK